MAATIATMAMLNAKCLTITNTTNSPKITKTPTKQTTLLSISKNFCNPSLAGTALAGAIFSTLSTADPAFAVQQIADIAAADAGDDKRGLALLLPIIPALGWVLFNILQPALNQINKMRNTKGVMIGVGLGGLLGTSGLMVTPDASAEVADQMAMIGAATASSDSRGTLLLFVVAPALLWVLYNILQPALNQINKMKSD